MLKYENLYSRRKKIFSTCSSKTFLNIHIENNYLQ